MVKFESYVILDSPKTNLIPNDKDLKFECYVILNFVTSKKLIDFLSLKWYPN